MVVKHETLTRAPRNPPTGVGSATVSEAGGGVIYNTARLTPGYAPAVEINTRLALAGDLDAAAARQFGGVHDHDHPAGP